MTPEIEIIQETDLYLPNRVDQFLTQVDQFNTSLVFDISLKKGRDECASAAYKISQLKTKIDSTGKALVDKLKEQPKLIDAERKKIRDRLDAIRDRVREPLTLWEQEEEKRIQTIKAKIKALEPDPFKACKSIAEFDAKIVEITAFIVDDSLGEYKIDALEAKTKALEYTVSERDKFAKAEKDREELARMQKEKEESDRIERERKMVQEASERDLREEKERAERELREEKERSERLARAEQEKRDQEKIAQEKREQDLRDQAAKAVREKEEAERRALEVAETAARAERERIAEEQRRQREADRLQDMEVKARQEAAIDIRADLEKITPFNPERVAEALVAGEIRSVNVLFY